MANKTIPLIRRKGRDIVERAETAASYTDGSNDLRITVDNGAFIGTQSSTDLVLKTNNTNRLTINTSGAVKLHNYGSGNNTGTSAYHLAVDSSGNVIESPAVNGTSGSSGSSGSSGNNGNSGNSGTSGSSGTSGNNGNNGTSGSSGSSGNNGNNGNSGTSGTSGNNGNNGNSGTSGSSGSSGLLSLSGTTNNGIITLNSSAPNATVESGFTIDGNALNATAAGNYFTFYGDSSGHHSISSRDAANVAADDLRINTYGALYINLDSNNNNTSGADFMIGRHGNVGTISDWFFTVNGENGNVGIGYTSPGYKLHVNGSFAATTKSFVIDHPTKPNKKLRYASLEGPENGVYVRGRGDSDIIELPDYWTGLVHEDSITVQITAKGKDKNNKIRNYSVNDIVGNKVYIYTDSEDNVYDYFYNVYAERKDVEKLEVEIDNGN